MFAIFAVYRPHFEEQEFLINSQRKSLEKARRELA